MRWFKVHEGLPRPASVFSELHKVSQKAAGKRRYHDYDITALRPGDVDVAKPEGKGETAGAL